MPSDPTKNFFPQEPEILKSFTGTCITIKGPNIRLSTCLPQIESLINQKVKIVKIYAFATLVLDCDLKNDIWHGKNLAISTEKLVISGSHNIDLSGITQLTKLPKAPSAKNDHEGGKDGHDGKTGESSGNLLILTNSIINPENLTIHLNGANGQDGQEGGDGFNGMDGVGMSREEFEKIMPKFGRSINRNTADLLKNFRDFKFKKVQSLIYHEINTFDYYEGYNDKGLKCIFSISLNLAGFVHAYMLVQGSQATRRTRGGRGGLGGRGGHAGKCMVIIKRSGEIVDLSVEAIPGKEGSPGLRGKNGKPGKDGQDVGFIQTPKIGFNKRKTYGGDGEKITLQFSKSPKSDSCYCAYTRKYLREKECYVSMIPYKYGDVTGENSDKNVSQKTEHERSKESKAWNVEKIDKTEIEKEYLECRNLFYGEKNHVDQEKPSEKFENLFSSYEKPMHRQPSLISSSSIDEGIGLSSDVEQKLDLESNLDKSLDVPKILEFSYKIKDSPKIQAILQELEKLATSVNVSDGDLHNLRMSKVNISLNIIHKDASEIDPTCHDLTQDHRGHQFLKKFLILRPELFENSIISTLNLEADSKNLFLRRQKVQKFIMGYEKVAHNHGNFEKLVKILMDLDKLKTSIGPLEGLVQNLNYLKQAPGLAKFGDDGEKIMMVIDTISESFKNFGFSASVQRIFVESSEFYSDMDFLVHDGRNGAKMAELLLELYFTLRNDVILILTMNKLIMGHQKSLGSDPKINVPYHVGYKQVMEYEELLKIRQKDVIFDEHVKCGPYSEEYRMIEAFLCHRNLKFYEKDDKGQLILLQNCFVESQETEHVLLEDGKFYGLESNLKKLEFAKYS